MLGGHILLYRKLNLKSDYFIDSQLTENLLLIIELRLAYEPQTHKQNLIRSFTIPHYFSKPSVFGLPVFFKFEKPDITVVSLSA